MTLQGSGCCRTLPGPACPVARWLRAKGGYATFLCIGGRIGVSFGVEQECLFLTFPLLFFLSILGDQTGKVPRAREIQGSKQWMVPA